MHVNVGVLGHVDSGKTLCVKALSSILSTASLDKHPASQLRGITLDLGFSSFTTPSRAIEVTLVDCPGHASLIKTIIGGIQIIDLAIVVLDITKGLQTQTVESILVAIIACSKTRILFVLNKIDLLETDAQVQEYTERITQDIIALFPKLGNLEMMILSVSARSGKNMMAIPVALEEMISRYPITRTGCSLPFLFAIDHCFAIKGKGTILTGTVLQGSMAVGGNLELPLLHTSKKIKSMQSMKVNVPKVSQGDRVGICVSHLSEGAVERGWACLPTSVQFTHDVIMAVSKISLFTKMCKSNGKMHITIGHTTVLATIVFFNTVGNTTNAAGEQRKNAKMENHFPIFDLDADYVYCPDWQNGNVEWALLRFEQEILCPAGSTVIASRLDLDESSSMNSSDFSHGSTTSSSCRLAFYGPVVKLFAVVERKKGGTNKNMKNSLHLHDLNIFKTKERYGSVDSIQLQDNVIIGHSMFNKESNLKQFLGQTVWLPDRQVSGILRTAFGKSGKFRIQCLNTHHFENVTAGDRIILRFATRMFTTKKVLLQRSWIYADLETLKRETSLESNNVNMETLKLKEKNVKKLQETKPATIFISEKENLDRKQLATATSAIASTIPDVTTTTTNITSAVGTIERLKGETTPDGRNPFVIVIGLFTDESQASLHVGHRVVFESSKTEQEEGGVIEKPFGKKGKVRIVCDSGGTSASIGTQVHLVL